MPARAPGDEPVAIQAAAETDPVPDVGDAADDPAIWVAPRRPERSTLIGTDKRGALAVYDLAGRELHVYRGQTPNNVDLRGGFRLGRRTLTIVATSDTASDTVRLYAVNAATRGLRPLQRPVEPGIGVSGLCLYRSPRSGLYVFVGDSSGTIQQWRLADGGGGLVVARKVRTLRLDSTTEGCVADDALARLYVAEEDTALWRYGAEPGAGNARTRVDAVGGAHLAADIEGLAIYRRPGVRGYLIASSQGSDSFAVYRRGGSNAHVFDFRVASGRIDEVTHTDGIEATSAPLGRAFPRGLFVAQDDHDESGRQNFKLVDSRALVRASGGRFSAARTRGRVFYVDARRGNDGAQGTSRASAWRSLRRVNAASLGPGDVVLFRRGGVWNGGLRVSGSGVAGSPVVVGAYGVGELPVIGGAGVTSCVVVTGSFVVVRELHLDRCAWAGVELAGGSDRLERSLVTGNAAGVDVRAGAVGARVLNNEIVGNDRMSILTASPSNDDSGAFGVTLHGDEAEVAWNRISGSDAFSYDYGRDGAAVEVYGGQRNRVHHNLAVDNHDFSELGNPRSADNSFAYNLVRSSLASATFLVTRGDQSGLGPVLGTRVYNNTVYLTGSSSQGFVCYAGCSAQILSMRNNIIQAAWKTGYADAPFDENNDIFYGGVLQFTKGTASIVADPQFVNPTAADFHLDAASPAIDRGVDEGFSADLDQAPVPVDGNGDGVAEPDGGAYERPKDAATGDTSPPTAPGSLKATSTTTSVTLGWSASSDNVGVSGYRVYRDGALVASTAQTSYVVGGLACGTSHAFGVEAYDAAGNTSARSSVTAATANCVDTSPPTAPSLPTASAATATSITLSWGVSTDNIAVVGYGLYRDGTFVGTTTMTTYTFEGLNCGMSYTLAVDAYDAARNHSTKSAVTTSTTPCADTTPPTAPTNLTKTGGTDTTIAVAWTTSTDNVGVAGYNVYRDGIKVGSTTATTYTFSALTCATSYTLGVEAYDAKGNVSGRTSLIAATAACTSPPPSPSGPCGTATVPPSSWQHVVWIVMENKQYGQIIGSSNAAYINSLASECGSATSMYAEAHPSLPNYIAMVSGSTQGIIDDSGPSSHPLTAASIFSQLGTGGWKSLEEDMPSNCYMSNSGNYAVRHNPATYFTNISAQCAVQDVPLGSSPDISARFTFVTPNICNDMHSCPTQSDIATEVKTGDRWLSTFVPKLTSTPEYEAGNTVIFVTWDEDDYSSSNANHIATLVISPSTPAGLTVTNRYDHYSMLRTTEELLGLSFIGKAADASSMASPFHLR